MIDCNTLLFFFRDKAESLDKGHLTPTLVITKIQGLASMKTVKFLRHKKCGIKREA